MTTVLLRRLPFDRRPFLQSRQHVHRARLRSQVAQYQEFVLAVGSQIGELSPIMGEDLRDIRCFVLLAARELGFSARSWIDDGKVYFYIRRDVTVPPSLGGIRGGC